MKNSVATNTGVIVLGNILSVFTGLAANILLVRYLGVKNYGIYSFVFAYLSLFGIITDFGISNILIREISKDKIKADKFLGNAVVMKVILSFSAILFSCLAVSFLNYPLDTKTLIYIASLSFLLSGFNIYGLIFQVNLQMKYPVFCGLLGSLIRIALIAYLVFLRSALPWFIIAEIIVNIPAVFIIFRLSKKFVRPKIEIDLALWKFIFKESWPLALSSIFVMIYLRIDQVMLFQMKGAESVGYYAPAVRLTEVFNILPAAFTSSLFPLFSRYFVTSGDSLNKTFALSAKYLMAIIIPVATLVTLTADKIIVLFYGKALEPSVPALIFLMWSVVFTFAGALNNKLLISVNKQWIDFAFTSTAAIINIGLNLILIPKYNFTGAAAATLVAYACGPVMNCVLKTIRPFAAKVFYSMLKPAFASAAMAVFIWPFRESLLYSVIIAAVAYITVMFSIKGFDLKELKVFNREVDLT
ncbi:MAG: flippase [Candidatus Omnitrophica bacterium]|nr:flippase [Candidatus Omnitrophota bacterium]